ncbi:MAG TPA: MlaD family protein [Burkholderiales bacterium]|nr:MlaD family protein [Burkholderiales bacterium]
MEPEARYTLVGAAVLVLVALVVGAFLWLRATGEGRQDLRYQIYFERQSLEGLQPRSPVNMRGIQVGVVTGFLFSPRIPGAVEVTISVEPTTPVRESTRAVVDRHLVTGIASIRLINLTEDSPRLAQAPPGETYPIIAEGETELQQFTETVAQLGQRADEVLRRINLALSDDNVAALGETLAAVQRLAQNAEQVVARLDSTLGAVEGAAGDVRDLAEGVAADTRRLAARYDALGQEAGVAVREVGGEATAALRDMAGAVRKLSAEATQLADRAGSLLASSDVELRFTAQEVRTAAEALADAARSLGDPRAALFGPAPGSLGPGEAAR